MRIALALLLCTQSLCAGALQAVHASELRVLPAGKGLILPIQDRTGSPETVEFLSLLTRQSLSAGGAQLEQVVTLRDTLRQLRIREATTATDEELMQLSRIFGVDWFASATLHELVRQPVPQITLSAQIFRADTNILEWSAFVSLTGLDRRTWLGLGVVESLDDLARRAAALLFADIVESPLSGRSQRRIPGTDRGFLLEPVSPQPSAIVAVVPFASIVDREPLFVAELQTRAWIAALVRNGYPVLRPGAILQVMRERGRFLVGEVDRPTALDLAARLEAKWVVTGTAETYEPGSGVQPNPWVAVGARLIHAASGRIHWIDGQEHRGSDRQKLFERGRSYSAAGLSLDMAQSMIAGFSKP